MAEQTLKTLDFIVGGNTYHIRPDAAGKAPLDSPTFTGTPTAPTAADGTNTTQIATTAFVMNAFTANDALVFKGTIGSDGATVSALPDNHKKGWTYKVATAGSYAGQNCEIGDTIICVTNGSSSNDAHWVVLQSNLDGAVTGPVSSTAEHIATFVGTSGKVIKDSGFTIGTSVPSDAVFTDTTYSVMTGASANDNGTSGLVPAPSSGDEGKYLKGDGTWGTPSGGGGGGDVSTITMNGTTLTPTSGDIDLGTVITSNPNMTGADGTNSGTKGLVPAPAASYNDRFLRGDGTWADPPTFTGADGTNAGTKGYVRAPGATHNKAFLCGDGTWKTVQTSSDSTDATVTFVTTVSTTDAGQIKATRANIRSATDEVSGIVSTSTQSFAGTKTFTGVVKFTNTAAASATTNGAVRISGGLGVVGNIYGAKVYNAVWNDYAECRKAETLEPGRCVTETDSGVMALTEGRLQAGCRLTSDTYGTCMGETDEARTPIAVAGRVLAYPFRDRNFFHLGDAVCSGPNGTVDIMTREEIREYPERIVGTVSEIPKYETWVAGTKEDPVEVPVNGRVWIYVR